MRNPKPKGGGNKPHSADKCGICAKPKKHKKKTKEKEILVDVVKESFNDTCEKCGRVYCDHENKY